jgi:iron complex transport system substrate-binding protein
MPPHAQVPPPRIATLLPSATEIVCALGLEDALVGVSHECDFPPSVAQRPVLTSTRLRPWPSSAAVDRDVRELLRSALAVYDVRLDELRAAAPDVIVTQDLCDVCAVSLRDVERAVSELAGPRARIVNLHPMRLADIWADIERVGSAVGRAREARELLQSLDERVQRVAARSRAIPERPHVLTIEWIDPVMIGGTWMPELVELAGGRALVARAGERAPTLTQGELAALDPRPDVVVVKPCGFAIDRTLSEASALESLFASLNWPAISNDRVWIADGNAYFNRPGPRIVDSLEILAACVHPREFADLAETHRGAFQRFAASTRR